MIVFREKIDINNHVACYKNVLNILGLFPLMISSVAGRTPYYTNKRTTTSSPKFVFGRWYQYFSGRKRNFIQKIKLKYINWQHCCRRSRRQVIIWSKRWASESSLSPSPSIISCCDRNMVSKDFQEKLSTLKYFVVGAGAIGCELL